MEDDIYIYLSIVMFRGTPCMLNYCKYLTMKKTFRKITDSVSALNVNMTLWIKC